MSKPFWIHGSKGRRPGSGSLSDKSGRILEYLAIIAAKYNIDPSNFLHCLMEAYNKEESERKLLNVRCRQKTEDSAIFLFTVGHDVIAQFPISTEIFQREKQLESYMKTISTRKSLVEEVVNPKIEDLRAGMKKVNLKAKILEIPQPNIVYTRLGTKANVTNVLIGDETGSVRMSLWNEQIGTVSKGDVIEIENGEVANYRGELQLRVGRSGCLRTTERS